jgi:excisionase family DNA binding protein
VRRAGSLKPGSFGGKHAPDHVPVMKKPTDKFLTTQEAADLLGLTRHTIARYCRSGRIKAVIINTGPRPIYRIRESDFSAFVRAWVRED